MVEYHEMSSLYGHDAFFKEFGWLGPRSASSLPSLSLFLALRFCAPQMLPACRLCASARPQAAPPAATWACSPMLAHCAYCSLCTAQYRLRHLLEGGIEQQLIKEEQQKPILAI